MKQAARSLQSILQAQAGGKSLCALAVSSHGSLDLGAFALYSMVSDIFSLAAGLTMEPLFFHYVTIVRY
jgi:hypothetical protein